MSSCEIKAVLLFSGGLDSIIAAQLLRSEGIQVFPVFCSSPFWKSENAKKAAKELNLNLRIIDVGEDIWDRVKNPKYGRGKGVNPCIDCKIMMLKKAKQYMKEIEAHFVATGEVLGERPMSQRIEAMKIISRESGLNNLLLRPLSAKLLPPTIPEERGWIKRENLLDISGRSRKKQLELIKLWGIDFFPSPAGGCILTDPIFSKRVRDLLRHDPEANLSEAILLKFGRHFRLIGDVKLVVGRNREENEKLMELLLPGDFLLKVEGFPGPIAILRGKKISPSVLELASGITLRYSDAPEDTVQEVKVTSNGKEATVITRKLSPEEVKRWMI